jgi:uncharacterized repeat protein (TIGR02543 family)/prepilin-type N-terminal cleavage/methylation domain-containing protein
VNLNKKGYTLIELLAVILIIGLILVLSTYGIIKAVKSSKEKVTTLSEKSIKEAAETYATEKNDDSNYWLDITDKENKYFCTTIEELMNKGLLDKKAESTKFKKSDFVLVKKNKVTNVNSKAEILTNDNNNDDYKVCSGNIVNEKVTEYPKLDSGTSYTDEIEVPFTDANTNSNSTMTDKVCMYGDSTANIKEIGVIEGNTCKLQGLKQNEKYYLRVCMKTSRESYLCSNTESRSTLQVKKPTYTLSSNTLTIKYNNANIKGEAKYYFKSTIKGTSNINVKRCTLSNNIFTCDGNTTTIEKDTWYQSSSNQINISYTTTGTAKVTARTVDKSNNYNESTKDFTINKYTITFNKGIADKIGGEVSNISKSCYAISGQSCSITSPDIEKKGYTIIGWNTNKNATTSIWNINTSKSISSSATYYPILKANIYTITLNNQGATSSGTKKVYYQYNTTKTINGTTCYYYTNSSLTTCLSGGYNINKPSKTGYSFKGYYTSTNGSGTNYVNSSGTFINNAYKTIGDKTLYANWQANTYTITYNANGGSGAPSSQSYTYDPNNDTVFYLSSTTPSRSGYTFLGWSLSSTATSASYSAGQRWGTHNANNYTLYAIWKKTVTVCGENGHVWKTRGIKIISTRFTWTCTRGENHTTAYIIYCSKCGMSALYYEDHYSGSAGATLMCPTHPYDIGSSEVDKVVDDCSLSSYSDAKKVSGGSNSFESTNKRSC